jgi:general secretion pathway protein B
VSFILDALRKSEHERQRSAVPGLSQVPLASPQPQLPRWALAVMAVLVAALLVIGGAWWQSTRAPASVATTTPTVERSVELPPPAFSRTAPQQAAPSRGLARDATDTRGELAAAAAPSSAGAETAAPTSSAPRQLALPGDAATLDLPSAAALAAEGIVVPALRLELHAYSERPRERFVFINGRKYVEGDRLAEGPQIVSIEPAGAVLAHAGRRFLLVQE